MRAPRVVAAAFVAAFAPTCLFAAETATVVGRVTDESKGILPGATVTARNVDTGVTRSAPTASDGTFRIAALAPGRYELTAQASGFAAVRRTGLILSLGSEATLDFALKVSERREEITVVADAPLVETTNATVQTTINRDEIDILPLVGRGMTELAKLAPGALAGGLAGSRQRANAFVIDGVDNAEDITGFSRQTFNVDAVHEVQVLINGFKAEHGRADGGVISVVTRSGSNRLSGRAFGTFYDESMIARGPFQDADEPETPLKVLQWGGHIGGPIIKDRTHFFASFEYHDIDTSSNITAPYPPPGAPVSAATAAFLRANGVPPFPDTSEGTRVRLVREEAVRWPKLSIRLDHAVNQSQSLVLRFNYERNRSPSGFSGNIFDANGSTDYYRTAYGNLSHKWVVRSNHLNELYLQVGETRFAADANFPGLTNIFIDEFSSGTPWLGGPTNFPQARTDRVFQLIDNYTIHLPEAWAGRHVVKFGGDAKIFRSDDFFDFNFRGIFFFRTVADFLAGRPRRFTQNSGSSRLVQPNNIYGVYVQDDWTLNRHLTLNLGLRYDYETGRTEALADVPDGSPVCALTAACGEAGPGISGDRNNVAPRFGVVWDPWGDGRTAVHGGAGIYYDQIILNIQGNARFTPPKVLGVQIENPTFPDPFQGGTSTALRPNVTVVDPNLVTPSAFATSFGVKRELTRDLAVNATFVYKRGRDQVAVLNTNSIDPVLAQRPNPSFTNVNLSTNLAEIHYRGLLIEVTKRMSNDYSFGLSYTLARNENDTETVFEGFVDPRNLRLNRGPGSEDRRHKLIGNVVARLPWSLVFGTVFEYRSPRPLDIFLGGVDLNRDGITSDWPPGYSRNSVRQLSTEEANRLRVAYGLPPIDEFADNPDFINVDLTLQKSVRLGGERRVTLKAELINAFNRANYATPSGNISSSLFGEITSLDVSRGGRPRGLELTLNFDF